jgi:uncharacterized protein DUF4388
MLIAGNFREYPFFLLLEIFLRRRETGLLEVSSTEESGYFYIKNGKVRDGQVGKNKGLAAVKVVGKFSDGSFRFKPLAAADYARVVWQRSFGPTGLADDRPPISVWAIRNKIGQFRFDPSAAYAFWKRAKVATRLLPIATINKRLRHLRSCIAAAYLVSRRTLAFSARRAVRQFVLYTPVVYHTLQKNGLLLIERAAAFATSVFALWKRAQLGTRLLRIWKKALAVRQDKRRGYRPVKPTYAREVGSRVPFLTIPRKAPITSALKQGIEHNVIFALVVTALLGLSGFMLHQLVFGDQHSTDTGISVDEHFDLSANTSRTKTKPKRHGSKWPSPNESKERSRGQVDR